MDQGGDFGDPASASPHEPESSPAGDLPFATDRIHPGLGTPFGEHPACAQSGLLSGLLEQLCSPLTSILSSTIVVTDDLAWVPREKRPMMLAMQREAVLLQSRSENLRTAAAIWEGSFALHSYPTAIGRIVAEVVPVVQPVLDSRGQYLEVRQEEATDESVVVDPRRVAQALITLLLCASVESQPGSALGIRLSFSGSWLRVSVASRGCVGEGPYLPGLFDLFHRPIAAAGGVDRGLELAVTRAIIEAHGATVDVRARKGGGSRVAVQLPRSKAREEDQASF